MSSQLKPKRSSEYDGRPRWLWPKICERCGVTYWIPKNQLKKRKFCSEKCCGERSQNRKKVSCATCGKELSRTPSRLLRSKSGLYFCSRSCKDKAQRLEGIKALHLSHYGKGRVTGIHLIRIRGHQCQKCGRKTWNNKPIPLEVHHINGNANNKKPDNLQLLCPNCHALTPTYGYRNRGYGRKSRGIKR